MGDDCTDSDSEFGSNLMLDLIRQEEGRIDRPLKKFSYKMRNLTSSSRNIFNDKYATLMRKIDENSSSSGSRSLSGIIYFPSRNLKICSESNSMLDVRKPQTRRWISNNSVKCENSQSKGGLQRTIHPIVRSVSDDSAMKKETSCNRNRLPQGNKKSFYMESESAINCIPDIKECTKKGCNCKVEPCLIRTDTMENLTKVDENYVDVSMIQKEVI